MPLTLYRRHATDCTHYGKARSARGTRNCTCPIWVQGSLGHEHVRRSLDLRSWEAASELVRGWDAAGKVGAAVVERPTIAGAVEKYLHDLEHGQHRKGATVQKHRNLLEKRLVRWCAARHYTDLRKLDVAAMREFRSSWPDSPLTASKNLERLRSFFRFCVDAHWVNANPAKALKPPKIGKASERVKVFTEAEITRTLAACDRYPERN